MICSLALKNEQQFSKCVHELDEARIHVPAFSEIRMHMERFLNLVIAFKTHADVACLAEIWAVT